jgi:transcriptional repressor NF-X1
VLSLHFVCKFYFRLDCTEECRIIERNRRLAIGLQIRNPDLSAKLTPRYSEFMRQWAKKDPYFCNMVHDKLTELVQLAKQVLILIMGECILLRM